MRISDWSSDVCSSDLDHAGGDGEDGDARPGKAVEAGIEEGGQDLPRAVGAEIDHHDTVTVADRRAAADHRRGDELVGLAAGIGGLARGDRVAGLSLGLAQDDRSPRLLAPLPAPRSEDRRVGKKWGTTC